MISAIIPFHHHPPSPPDTKPAAERNCAQLAEQTDAELGGCWTHICRCFGRTNPAQFCRALHQYPPTRSCRVQGRGRAALPPRHTTRGVKIIGATAHFVHRRLDERSDHPSGCRNASPTPMPLPIWCARGATSNAGRAGRSGAAVTRRKRVLVKWRADGGVQRVGGFHSSPRGSRQGRIMAPMIVQRVDHVNIITDRLSETARGSMPNCFDLEERDGPPPLRPEARCADV